MIHLLERRPILTIIAVVGIMLLPSLDSLEVTIMEARNFITAREMLTDGNWILPTINGEPRYEKPPLPSWLTAISGSIFGIKSVWAMRFPAVLMVMLLGSMIFMLSRKLNLSMCHSLINGLVCVTSLYVVLIIFGAPWDIFAHTFALTGIYFLFKNLHREAPEKRHFVNSLWAVLCIGASILSKGPVSLYVLFLPFLLSYSIIYNKRTDSIKWVEFLISIFFALVLGFSWYFYVRYTDPATFAAMTDSETGNWTTYNVRPFYYYWSFFVQSGPWMILAFMSLLYPYLKTRVIHLKAYQFTLLWTLLAVVLLSIIPEKKSRYLMPVLIPLSINIGFYIAYLARRFKELKDRRETWVVYFNFGLISFVFLFAFVFFFLFYANQVIGVDHLVIFFVLVTPVIGFFLFKKLKHKEIVPLFYILITGIAITVPLILKFSEVVASSKVVNFTAFEEYPERPIYALNIAFPELIWEYGSAIPLVKSDQSNTEINDRTFYVLGQVDKQPEVEQTFPNAKVTYLFTLNLNRYPKGSRNYKTRKTAQVYLVER